MDKRRILFSGYARVHFVCFYPVYQELRKDPRVELFLSGGFKSEVDGEVSFSTDGFYDEFDVDRSRILSAEEARQQDFDVMVCAHLSDTLFPRSANRSVQVFHGVSFKNLAVREKALRYDYLCLPGRYHADQYLKQGLVRPDASKALITGFPKVDSLLSGGADDAAVVGFDSDRPTVLLAPTGDKHNTLEIMGRELIEALRDAGFCNLLVKPHDHPKKDVDWFSELADLEGPSVRLVRGTDVAPCLRAASVLVTDASSVAIEYTLLDRPMVFVHTPKLLERLKKRAPALDLETYGHKLGTLAESPEDVVEAIRRSLADPEANGALRRQAAGHLFHMPGEATQQVAAVVRHAAGLEAELPSSIVTVDPE